MKIRVGIVGGAGYTGGELLRLLLLHQSVSVQWVQSESNAGKPVWTVHRDLLGETDVHFTATPAHGIDVVFICSGHGSSATAAAGFHHSVRIIDLSQDFRLQSPPDRTFVYGLCEVNRNAIVAAQHIANPGCFATAIQLALAPLAAEGILPAHTNAVCTTGATGAGQAPSRTSHYAWRDNNLSVYKPFQHQHLAEINMTLGRLQPGYTGKIAMLPQRGAFARGILACITMSIPGNAHRVHDLLAGYYSNSRFVKVTHEPADLKQVVNTNKCMLEVATDGDDVMIVSVIDNLLKGASGQAVQNMNLMLGLPEDAGLRLKASAF